ncbi:cytochrome c3 family protein [Acidobacteriota bacterium]
MKNFPTLKTLGIIGLSLLFASFMFAAHPYAQESDAEACLGCHEDMGQTFAKEPHSALNNCVACHGNAEKHLDDGGGAGNIMAFGADDATNAKIGMCLNCHAKSNSQFLAGPHGKSAMDCTTCHVIHGAHPKPDLLKTGATKSCLACHEDVYAMFQLNERHRLQEGILGCTSCHNPHESSVRERLGGFKDQTCKQCHQDKGGPFLYEHGASQIEGCSACHEVHGSPNRHMLKNQSGSDLCFSCHTFAPSFHSRFTSATSNCTVCHSTIHGSNLSKIFLK